jgi:hypothetical protein
MTVVVTLLSVLTCLVSGWMTVMFLLLRHPHYLERAAMGMVIMAGSATLAAGGERGRFPVRATLSVWALALLGLGVWALVADSGDDGWVLIAGALFVAEGLSSIVYLLRGRTPA